MADKLLKSVTFPDLTDKYIVADPTLSVSGAGADAKATGDALATKADADGSYDNLTAGNAKQLISNVKVNDQTPYIFRTSGGSVDIGDREYVNGIVGGTVAWNQLAKEINTTNWHGFRGTISVNDGVISFTADTDVSGKQIFQYNYANVPVNHVVVASALIKPPANTTAYISFGGGNASAYKPITENIWNDISAMRKLVGDSTELSFYLDIYTQIQTGAVFQLKNPQYFDLTQMFGSTIADYIYSLETANAGAGVAWFKKLFPKPYYAYNAGELKSVSGLVSHDMTGFNQFDGEVELGNITASGEDVANDSCIRSKNYIKVLPNTTYYFYAENSDTFMQFYKLEYDVNKNVIDRTAIISGSNLRTSYGAEVTTGSNTCYVRCFVYRSSAFSTPNNQKFNINISWDGSRDGEYEPYELHSYPLDTDLTLRGIPKLDANNNLYYDGDTYESDGTVTRKYGIVDLGTLTYTKEGGAYDGEYKFQANLVGIKPNTSVSHVEPVMCSKYIALTPNDTYLGTNGISVETSTYGYIAIHDSSLDSKTASEFKTAMNGVYLVYELATPTTETADPYQQTQIVNDFGTEEYKFSNSVFPVLVGSDTDYPINVLSKVEMAPNSPSGDGDYIVRQTNGMNEYVPLIIEDALPTIPSTEGSYKLIVTVAEGSDPVLSWVSNA